jgi:hypothetical protein
MKYTTIMILLLPALLCAQELQFRQEYDSIPVEINGWQTFAPWGGGESESYPEFCDLDGDGDVDIFVGNGPLGFISHYKNEGMAQMADFKLITRAFNGINLFQLPWGAHVAPNFCDLDGDADSDLFVGDFAGLIHFWENVGTTTVPQFQFITDTLANIDITGFSRFDFVDIDADGDFDLFIGNWFGTIWYYRNAGNTSAWNLVQETSQFAGIDVGNVSSPVFVDIDADGDFDLFIGNMAGNICYYRNDGDSINYNFTYVANFYDSIWVQGYAAPEFSDIDADGDFDLFVGRDNVASQLFPGDVFFYENVGTPAVPQWNLVTQNYLSLDPGVSLHHHQVDIDADLDVDLFITNPSDQLSFYENVGTPQAAAFHWVTDGYQNIAVNGAKIFFDDIDADQDPDLFIGEVQIPNPPYPSLYLFQNRGTPQNAAFTLYSNNVVPGTYPVVVEPALTDIDGDSDHDLFVTDGDENRFFFENSGTPTSPVFANSQMGWWGAFPFDTLYYTVLAGYCFYDIDNDGDQDLFGTAKAIDVYNWVWFYRNIGTAQSPVFNLETQNLLTFERNEDLNSISIFDADADGDGDIFVVPLYDGGMYFFRNITGEASAPPPVQRHPQAGLQISLGPNPANPNTVISFNLPFAQQIDLAVYNLLGARVTTLASGLKTPGSYVIPWDASGNASGVYIIRLETPQESRSEKLTIIK